MKGFKFVVLGLVCFVSLVNKTSVLAQQLDQQSLLLVQDDSNNLASQQNNQQDLILAQNDPNNLAFQQNNQQDLIWAQNNPNNLAFQQNNQQDQNHYLEMQQHTGVTEQQNENLTFMKNLSRVIPDEIKFKFQDFSDYSFPQMMDTFRNLTDSEFEYFIPVFTHMFKVTLDCMENGQSGFSAKYQKVLLKGNSVEHEPVKLLIKNGDFFGEDKLCPDNYGGYTIDEEINPREDHHIYLSLRVPKNDKIFKDIDKIYIEFKRLSDGKIVLTKEGIFSNLENSGLYGECVSFLKDCSGFSENRVNRIMEKGLSHFLKERYSKFLEMVIDVNKDNFYDFENKVGDLEDYEINIYKDSSKKEKVASSEDAWKFDVNILKRLLDSYR